MTAIADKTKGKIKIIANKSKADPRVLMRIYMMERFLERISKSNYRENIIIKGGILITSLVGISMRSTLDIDTSVKSLDLSDENILKIIKDIMEISLDDGVCFEIKRIEKIMDEMEYSGIRVHMNALCDSMITPIKVDISTGDVITPQAIEYQYNLLTEKRVISLYTYNLETILAEKLQTILVRERANTRMRDFYDVYSLMNIYSIQKKVFERAYKATCRNRKSLYILNNEKNIIKVIAHDSGLRELWRRYQRKYKYAESIEYIQTIDSLQKLISFL